MMVQTTFKIEEITYFPVDRLDLDPENPRFAGALGAAPLQPRILDYIAETVGLKDLLSSMSHSGYYLSVPLIGVPEKGRVTIVEGNRRLATAFILLGDERAPLVVRGLVEQQVVVVARELHEAGAVPQLLEERAPLGLGVARESRLGSEGTR